MPARSGSWAGPRCAGIAATTGRSLEVTAHDPAAFRFKRRTLDRLFLHASPAAARGWGRPCDVGQDGLRRNFDADAAALATLRIGQQHLLGGSRIGRLGGGAAAERLHAVAGLIAFTPAGISGRAGRLRRRARAPLLLRPQPFELGAWIDLGA